MLSDLGDNSVDESDDEFPEPGPDLDTLGDALVMSLLILLINLFYFLCNIII